MGFQKKLIEFPFNKKDLHTCTVSLFVIIKNIINTKMPACDRNGVNIYDMVTIIINMQVKYDIHCEEKFMLSKLLMIFPIFPR
jgi:hypothetical protein